MSKVENTATGLKKGSHQEKKTKKLKKVTFKRPKTHAQKRTPLFPVNAVSKLYTPKTLDVVLHPLGSEAAV